MNNQKHKPRYLDTERSNDQEKRNLYLSRNKEPFNPAEVVAKVTNELPFVGIMLYGFKHKK